VLARRADWPRVAIETDMLFGLQLFDERLEGLFLPERREFFGLF
jgi:hypothetical protein